MQRLQGRAVSSMGRRGKFLCFNLDNGDILVLHLRMTGQLLVTPQDYPLEKHTHFIADFSGGEQIRFVDVRRFGRFWYLGKEEPDTVTSIDKLGPEPDDPKLNAEYLTEKLGKRKKAIKEALLDQSIVAGIGNIYADEILFACGIHPEKKCSDLTRGEMILLAELIPEDIASIYRTTVSHRLILSQEAKIARVDTNAVLTEILHETAVPFESGEKQTYSKD